MTLYVCPFVQQRTGLKGREKEQMWKELLKVLRPAGHLIGPSIFIPEEDDFDPDTYGKPVEHIIEGKLFHAEYVYMISGKGSSYSYAIDVKN